MKGRKSNTRQCALLPGDLLEHLDPKAPLILLSQKIPWDFLENELSSFYSEIGRPAKPVRLMCGLMILKQMRNLSDDGVIEAWCENPYYQAFCGEMKFHWQAPCASSDLSHFRKRIGEEGFEKIFTVSVLIHGPEVLEKEVLIDTTVQEKNITFPTDSKLQVKIISWLWKNSIQYGYKMRRSYKAEVRKLIRLINFCRSPKDAEIVSQARQRLKAIATTLLREAKRRMPAKILVKNKGRLEIFDRILTQKKNDKNKIYSVHEPQTQCIAKGKCHKKYEFGAKACIVVGTINGVILGAQSFAKNIYDGDSIEPIVKQMIRILNYKPELIIGDMGFRGRNEIEGVKVLTPATQHQQITESEKKRNRKRLKRRSAIEPVIGHLKTDYRMARNFLKGILGDTVNALMAAAAFNFKKWLRLVQLYFYFCILRFVKLILRNLLLDN